MEDNIQPAKNDLANLSIKDLFYKYIRFLPLFILSVAVALLVSYTYLRYATLIYRSTGSLVIRDDQSRGGGNDKFDEILQQDGAKNIQNEIEILKSRPLMERVVRRLDLTFSYYALGNIKELNVYTDSPFRIQALELTDSTQPFSINIKFDSEHAFRVNNEQASFRFGKVFRNAQGVFSLERLPGRPLNNEYDVKYAPVSAVAAALNSSLVVSPKSNTNILVLQLEATNPKLAADVINTLISAYGRATIDDKNETTQQTLEFIDSRLADVQQDLDSITRTRLAYQQANNLIDFETQSTSYFGRVEEADRQLNEQRVQLDMANMISGYLQEPRNEFTRVPSTLGLQDPTLSVLISAYNVAQMERQQLVDDRVPRGNVLLGQKEEQVRELRSRILENLRNVRSSLGATIGNLQQENTTVQSQIRALPVKQQNLIEIERQQQAKLAVFNYLSEKREESAIALASTIPASSVLEEALPNMNPVKPDAGNTRILAILVGLLLPAVSIFVIELMNDKVTTRNDIERITTATILGEVGHSQQKGVLVVTQNNRTVVAEQFRIIRSNLQYVLNHVEKPVIMITSSFSGEGKSFISTNMGAVMSLAGKKTIILEFDIRKPKIISELGMPKSSGLSNYLLGKVEAAALPVPVPGQERLFVLPCGPIPPNPSELLLDTRLNDLFAYLKAEFDVVIMDTAPVGMVSDAQTLSRFADCTLYIVRQGHTFKRQIALLDEFHTGGKLPKINIVLNDVKIRSGYGQYGYGQYGYGYGYGAGYFEEDKPASSGINRWLSRFDVRKWSKKKARAHK